MKSFLLWLTQFLRVRVIDGEEGDPYLERYFVFHGCGITIYLHRFVASDPDRGLHDHPWSWALALLLSGGYDELRRDGAHRRRWANWLTGDTFHRVLIAPGTESWSLFIHGRRTKPWGFWRNAPPPRTDVMWQPVVYPPKAIRDDGTWRWWVEAPTGAQQRAGHNQEPRA